MTAEAGPSPSPDAVRMALRRMAAMQQITLDVLQAGSRQELFFIIVNKTAAVARFDRATLWQRGKNPRLLAVSGVDEPNPHTVWAEAISDIVRARPDTDDAVILDSRLDGSPSGGLLWLSFPGSGSGRYGLLLEKLTGPSWSDAELKTVKPLAAAYGSGLALFDKKADRWRGYLPRGNTVWSALAFLVLLLLVLVRLPLRIVAPCDVIATSPIPVNAPLDGVIRSIAVRPGDTVAVGDELYRYDDDIAREEIAVIQKQVELARSNLERVMSQAVSDRTARAEARMLQNRLAQEELRLAAYQGKMEKLVVAAPLAGTVVMGDPAAIIGKPIRVGEEVLLLADQDDNRLRIWLPQDDRIEFAPEHGVKVFLHADAGRSRSARLVYVAAHAQMSMDGVYGFMAEAEWPNREQGIKLGLKGTAVLYGEDVTLGYWLARKPLAAVRRFLGI